MAATSDDDVQDGDTTAAGVAPATSSADEEDRTVQQPPDPKIRNAIAKELHKANAARSGSGKAGNAASAGNATGASHATPRAAVAVPSATKPGAAPPVNVTSKRMTVVGLAPPAAGSAAAPPAIRAPAPMSSPGGSPGGSSADKKAGPSSSRAAGAPSAKAPSAPQKPPGKPPETTEADDEDSSITATAPAPRVGAAAQASTGVKPPPLPLTVPGQVQIREMSSADDEPLDETEVRTVVSSPPPDDPPAVPAQKLAPIGAAAEDDDEELEDSVTTQAPSAVKGSRLPEEDEPKTSPPMRMPPPIPAAGRSAADEPARAPVAAPSAGGEDAYNVEDSVTTRGPAVPDFRLDESTADNHLVAQPAESAGRRSSPGGGRAATMSQALGLPPKNAAAAGRLQAIEDSTEGTTNRLAGHAGSVGHAAHGGAMKPARTTPSSISSPAALNLPPKVGAAADEDEDDLAEDNRTAVMIGAPVKPNGPSGSSRAARAQLVGGGGMAGHLSAARAQAPSDKASSESGLRIAHEQPPQPSDERASLGAMMAGALNQHHGPANANDRGSGIAAHEHSSHPLPPLQPHQVPHHYPPSEPNLALGATIPANSPLLSPAMHGHPMPQMQQYDFAATIKKPRYGLLVGLVALLSFAIPLVLFLWLHQNVQEPYIRSPSEVASDKQGLAPPQGTRLAPPPAVSTGKRPRR